MYYAKVKQMIGSVVLLAIAGLALQPSIALASDEPELPAECSSIQVEAGNKVSFHVYARGVQIYRWNGSSWVFVAPLATLFAEKNYFG
jgi:hypothetical protein